MKYKSLFLNDRICLNVLSHDIQNAKGIYEITDGHVIIGMLSKNYDTNEAAIESMGKLAKEIDNNLSIGLGAGDPNQWKMVAELAKELQPKHVNQINTAVGCTRGLLGQDDTIINALVSPTEKVGYVNLAVGPLASQEEETMIPIKTAIAMLKEMGANSVKLYPMNGLSTKEAYKAVCEACAETNFMLEPTGGINLDNFEEILQIAIDANVPRIIPHVYTSVIDQETGLTRLDDVQKLYDIMKKLV